ncbi:tweety family protein [Gramella sp. GC03-9]|uniref:Tweety family protein n=1 Tax=Christiangramia oceanisediminis TaxID=2920386 RepID=A0A9X2KX99_9FLAO|nr:tweety family protein [Gramella oceanisediminis]MCP9198766.1 tweety family protein [Gramella oceanisediminis]
MTLHKILKYLALVIGVIGLILLGRIIATGDDAIKASADLQGSHLDPYMWIAYLVLFAVIVIVALFVIVGLFRGNIKNTLIAVGSFLVIVVIAYMLSEGTARELKDGTMLSASGDHWVGAGLITFYILAGIAVASMVFSGIKKLAK